ncbi:FAD/NAD-P-binding domain-containing protein [Hysterangium stoloniferum]|nr:FAD/NAD-P-binding domain-containing protein [Hysterangium stoloniferum]
MEEGRLTSVDAARAWLHEFANAFLPQKINIQQIKALFLEAGWLRDNLVFTWTHRSLCGHDAIEAYLSGTSKRIEIYSVALDESYGRKVSLDPHTNILEATFVFETPIAYGRGHVLLQSQDKAWKALSVYVAMTDLKDHEEMRVPNDITAGEEEAARRKIETDPHVLIIGAGQTGLNNGARFRKMNIPTLLIDRSSAIGDVWRNRYPSLTLHTNSLHHTLLYTRHPPTVPRFIVKDEVAAMLEKYAHDQGLTVWLKSTLLPRPTYDAITKRWTVHVSRDGQEVILHPFHIVLATGIFGTPYIPHITGSETFFGDITHTTNFKGPEPYANKNTIVIGASQSAADICRDLATHGARSVTMIQRSRTVVVSESVVNPQMNRLWREDVDPLISDFYVASMPLGLLKQILIAKKDERVAQQKDMLEGLKKAGLHVHEGEDGAGHLYEVFRRGSGTVWIDKGTIDLIIQDKIHVRHGIEPVHFTPKEVIFSDGTAMSADLVIFATGYEPAVIAASKLFGEDIARLITPIWGLNSEHESRRSYTPSGHPAIWWAIGDFMYSRYYSKSLALQIKAREIGLVGQEELRNLQT